MLQQTQGQIFLKYVFDLDVRQLVMDTGFFMQFIWIVSHLTQITNV